MNRRDFLKTSPALGLFSSSNLEALLQAIDSRSEWKDIAKAYPVHHHNVVNLNSGSAGNMSSYVERSLVGALQEMNRTAAYRQKVAWKETYESCLLDLSSMIGVSPEDIALTRNTTDGLNRIINNIQIDPGETIYACVHDYPYALNALKKRSFQDSIKLEVISYDQWADDQHLIEEYRKQVKGPGVLLLTHVQHRSGRIVPVQKISEVLKTENIRIILDAAHSYHHFEYKIPDMGIDYYATSLHKWLTAPLGSGMIYISPEQRERMKTRSSAPADKNALEQVEYSGTDAFYRIKGIRAALDWSENIGGLDRKEKRLKYLTDYWTAGTHDIENLRALRAPQYGAIGGLRSLKYSASELLHHLEQRNFHAKKVGNPNGEPYLRISMNVFITEDQLDQFISVLKELHA